MKQILLKRIQLTNWKAKNLDVTFNEGPTKISAKNEVGKSSLQQAWNWLFSSHTTPTANKNADLYDNRVELTPDTPEASVKVWIAIDGIEYTIERTAKAKFKRPRGQAEYVKDASDVYTTKVDDIELSATNFNDWVEANICPVENITYLLDGAFFSTLADNDKMKARAVLERMVGEIKPEDFSGDYELIEDRLAKYSPEQIKEQASNQLRPVRKRMDEIPAVIDSKTKLIADYDSENWDAVEVRIKEIKEEIESIDLSILGRQTAIKPMLDKRNEILEKIAEAQSEFHAKKVQHHTQFQEEVSRRRREMADIDANNARIAANNARKALDKKQIEIDVDKYERAIDTLQGEIKRYEQLKQQAASATFSESICPTCGQQLPLDYLDKARQAFFTGQVETIANYDEEINSRLNDIAIYKQTVEGCKCRLSSNEFDAEAPVSLAPYEDSLTDYIMSHVAFEDTSSGIALLANIESLNNSIEDIPDDDAETLTINKKTLIEELETLNKKLGLKDKANELRKDIAALIAEKKALACEMAHLEGVQVKCQEYIEERAKIISDRINDRLDGCKIVMFNVQKNGERTPDCILTNNDGVRYSTLSTSAKLRVNIAVQQLFRKHYAVDIMTWVDEAAVFDKDSLPAPKGQVCYLFASDSPTLVVE